MSQSTALLFLLSIPVVLVAIEAWAYRALGWGWGPAVTAAGVSTVAGLVLGLGVLFVLGTGTRWLSLYPPVAVVLLGLGLGAVTLGAAVARWLAPSGLRGREVHAVSAGVKVLALLFVLSGLYLLGEWNKYHA